MVCRGLGASSVSTPPNFGARAEPSGIVSSITGDISGSCVHFDSDFGAKYPKAVASLTEHQDELLSFYDFPAEHWEHIRTANPIESAFATVRLRQRVTKGAGSRSKALLMAYKLLDMGEPPVAPDQRTRTRSSPNSGREIRRRTE